MSKFDFDINELISRKINDNLIINWFYDNYNIEYLYHFTTVDNLMKILLTDSFRIGNVANMNDINESLPIYQTLYNRNELSNELTDVIAKESDVRRKTYLGCFSALNNDSQIREKVSMWGHYANKGSGVCIKINKNKLDRMLFTHFYDIEFNAFETSIFIEKFKISYKE